MLTLELTRHRTQVHTQPQFVFLGQTQETARTSFLDRLSSMIMLWHPIHVHKVEREGGWMADSMLPHMQL